MSDATEDDKPQITQKRANRIERGLRQSKEC